MTDKPTKDVADTTTLFPLRLLGMGLIFAWDWCLGLGTMVDQVVLFDGLNVSSNFVIVFSQIIALVVLALLSSRLKAISHCRPLFVGAALGGVVGPILTEAVLYGAISGISGVLASILNLLGCLLTGFASAVLILAWAEVYARMEAGPVMLYGALSLVFGVACYAIIWQSSEVLQTISTWAIPLASFVMCALSWRYVGREPVEGREHIRYSFPWKPVVIMGVCGFAAAFIDIALFMQGIPPHMIADVIVGVVLVFIIVLLHRSVKPVWLVGVSLVCMAAGIVFVAVLGAAAAFGASLLAMLSYVIMTFFTCALLADTCHRRDIPSLWLFGFAWAARVLMDHVGGFAGMFFPQLPQLAGSPLDLALMAVVGLVMVGVVVLIWMSERSFKSDWAIHAIDAKTGQHVPSEHEILLAGCPVVADTAGLTEREAEMLEMLVEGRTYQEICSSLLLSSNTVKTHTRHMYAKLGVHTREEAIELVRKAGRKAAAA